MLCITHIIHTAKNHLTFTCMKRQQNAYKTSEKEKNCVDVKTYDRLPTIIISIIYFGLKETSTNGLESMTAFRLKQTEIHIKFHLTSFDKDVYLDITTKEILSK